MSTNLTLSVRYKLPSGKEWREFCPFLWQTPTEVTKTILSKPDILAAYLDWVEIDAFDDRIAEAHRQDVLAWLERWSIEGVVEWSEM